MSLMEPQEAENGLFIDSIFDKKQYWIWTADTATASLAWLVDFISGDCDLNDIDGYGYVRAVR